MAYTVNKVTNFASKWPYTAADFRRMDESVDTEFYTHPRFVQHIDDGCIAALTQYYANELPRGSVLDLCSSWVSHLPKGYEATGIGLNKAELDANPALTRRLVQDLNVSPSIPYRENEFDAVICNVSIDYLSKPLEIMREIHRVLKSGSRAHMAFSNRCFPTKVVSKWLKIEDEERPRMVADYFHFASANAFKNIEIVEAETPHDPLWIVRATKQ